MKTFNFKSFFPLLLMVVAITSAFAFQMEGKESTVSVTGWIDYQTPCSVAISCDNDGEQVCTEFYMGNEYEVKAKNHPEDATCPLRLTRLE